MTSTLWALTGCTVGLLVFAAAMPWLDRRFTAARGLRDLGRHLRATGGPYSARGATAGAWGHLSPEWPPEAPSRPACGCWVHHLNAADLEAAINQIAAHLTEGTD